MASSSRQAGRCGRSEDVPNERQGAQSSMSLSAWYTMRSWGVVSLKLSMSPWAMYRGVRPVSLVRTSPPQSPFHILRGMVEYLSYTNVKNTDAWFVVSI